MNLFLIPNATLGQFVLSPVAVIGTDLGTFSPTAPLESMINQSGIDAPFVSGTTDFDTYFATPGQPFGSPGDGGTNNWQSDFSFDLPLMGYVDFDLGASYSLDKMAVWNRSISNVTVRISDDTNSLATEQIAGSFKLSDHLNYPYSYEVDVVPFGASYVGRYVRLQINSTYQYSPSDSFAYAIIGEVVFSALPATTEPPTVSIGRGPNGEVHVTFTGTLQSSTNVVETFEDVPGNSSGDDIIPKADLSTMQYFRAKGN